MSDSPKILPISTLPQKVEHVIAKNFVSAHVTGALVSGPLQDGTFQLQFVEDVLAIDSADIVYSQESYKVGETVEARLDYANQAGVGRREIVCRLRLTPAALQEAAMVMLQQLAKSGSVITASAPGPSRPSEN